MKSLDEYSTKLGKFWVNFNSLELLLRLYITKKNAEPEIGLELAVGATCPLSHLTNYDSFERLTEKYNALVTSEDRIDTSEIARLRNAIAHGRVTTKTDVPLTVVKFSKPDRCKGTVTVEFREVLTAEYLDGCIKQSRGMIMHLAELITREFPRRD